jgi:hypothetical protein
VGIHDGATLNVVSDRKEQRKEGLIDEANHLTWAQSRIKMAVALVLGEVKARRFFRVKETVKLIRQLNNLTSP